MSLNATRADAVGQTLARIRSIAAARGINRDSLEEIAVELKGLATKVDLFPADEFPCPPAGDPDASTRYLIHKEADDTFALYLNSINPGKSSAPHNHTTWAVITALVGEELNRIYERVDDGSDPERAKLDLKGEVVVSPGGNHVAFLADDIHSIHVVGDHGTRHFHLYGLALERLTGRVGYDLEAGRVVNYNKNYHSDREVAANVATR
jgi:predicted metal-dependent enzyme (double-stranded beta helix superfamily)